MDIPIDTLAWRLQALDLITLHHPAYYFDVNNDWHPEANCWIGELPDLRKVVAIFCYHENPSQEQLGEFIDYVKRTRKKSLKPDDAVIIAAIKEGAHAEAYVNGFKVEIFSESTLLDELVDFTYYFKHLKNRVELQNLADSEKTLADVYAP